jgi:hypothetical protein
LYAVGDGKGGGSDEQDWEILIGELMGDMLALCIFISVRRRIVLH